ncbi:MAG: hypothetical protein BIFFINMI_03654 [Phycisphaerae bacterium]|nr:hypothetical protein [Phycisphaerae bacterium]
MRFFKFYLPISLAFAMAILGITSVFVPHHYSDNFQKETVVWFRVLGGVTMFIGAYSLLKVHFNRIRRQQKGWGYSALLYAFFITVITCAIVNYDTATGKSKGPLEARNMATKDGVNWIFNAIQRPASATQYSLLGFFICSAAYRTFRAKTVEAAVLLVAALIVMLGQVPLSATISGAIPWMSNWLLNWPNMAVKRAILFGICVGSVGTSLRVMFGIERSYMGGD